MCLWQDYTYTTKTSPMDRGLQLKTSSSLHAVAESSSPLCPMLTNQEHFLRVNIIINIIHVNRIIILKVATWSSLWVKHISSREI
jgi:hypothetical protein